MKNIYLICNLHSGKASVGGSLAGIIDRFTEASCEVTVHPTQHAGDGKEAAQYACASGKYDAIVCCGGDGTLNEVIQGCMLSELRLPIGYIPTGSTNDFAHSLNIPKNAMEAVAHIINSTPVQRDIGSFNEDYFTYVAAFGAFTEISYQTAQPIKNILGHAAYLLNGITGVKRIRSRSMRIEHDGQVREGDYIYGMITNSSSVAKLLSLPDVQQDDGYFEVTLIRKPKSLLDLQHIITGLLNIQLGAERQYFDYFRAREVVVTALDEEPVSWTIDGEYGGSQQVSVIRNNPRALTFLLQQEALREAAADAPEAENESL